MMLGRTHAPIPIALLYTAVENGNLTDQANTIHLTWYAYFQACQKTTT